MFELRPFTGEVVIAERAHRIVAPPYDALDPAARAALAAADPDSYLGALPPGTTGGGDAVLDAALSSCRTHLEHLLATGRYRPVGGPAVGVLELRSGTSRATAIVGDVPVGAFADGGVLPHEQVTDARVHALARYLEVVGVASSPVALAQEPDHEVTSATEAAIADPPDVAYRAEDGVDVALWCITAPDVRERLCAAVAGAGRSFLADGHHRAAAATRYARAVGAGADDPAGRVLCAVLPTDHLGVLAFHRRIDDVLPDAAASSRMFDRIAAADLPVARLDRPAAPDRAHTVTLTAGGRWWHLDVSSLVRADDVVEALDVQLVERDVVPLVRSEIPEAEVVAVPTPLGLGALDRPGSVGIALHPPAVEDVLTVARAGRTVPPKTTYITPKLRSGLLVTRRPPPGATERP
ncbi:MAG: DUF1015 family protein [Nitriliruptor sp.]|uniref:DUF1015 family protein n=1 Tax=Nitriliruptor sp. TaxID=2448056 RepID=UPI00349FF2FA